MSKKLPDHFWSPRQNVVPLFALFLENQIFAEKNFFAKKFVPLIRFVLARFQPKLMIRFWEKVEKVDPILDPIQA